MRDLQIFCPANDSQLQDSPLLRFGSKPCPLTCAMQIVQKKTAGGITKYLKSIGKVVELDKPLASGCGKRTFCSKISYIYNPKTKISSRTQVI